MAINTTNRSKSASLSQEKYDQYEQEYKNWQKTGQYSEGFNSWKNDDELATWRSIRDGQGRSALKDGTYYYQDKDTYALYDNEYNNWKTTGKYSDGYDLWGDESGAEAFKAIRDYDQAHPKAMTKAERKAAEKEAAYYSENAKAIAENASYQKQYGTFLDDLYGSLYDQQYDANRAISDYESRKGQNLQTSGLMPAILGIEDIPEQSRPASFDASTAMEDTVSAMLTSGKYDSVAANFNSSYGSSDDEGYDAVTAYNKDSKTASKNPRVFGYKDLAEGYQGYYARRSRAEYAKYYQGLDDHSRAYEDICIGQAAIDEEEKAIATERAKINADKTLAPIDRRSKLKDLDERDAKLEQSKASLAKMRKSWEFDEAMRAENAQRDAFLSYNADAIHEYADLKKQLAGLQASGEGLEAVAARARKEFEATLDPESYENKADLARAETAYVDEQVRLAQNTGYDTPETDKITARMAELEPLLPKDEKGNTIYLEDYDIEMMDAVKSMAQFEQDAGDPSGDPSAVSNLEGSITGVSGTDEDGFSIKYDGEDVLGDIDREHAVAAIGLYAAITGYEPYRTIDAALEGNDVYNYWMYESGGINTTAEVLLGDQRRDGLLAYASDSEKATFQALMESGRYKDAITYMTGLDSVLKTRAMKQQAIDMQDWTEAHPVSAMLKKNIQALNPANQIYKSAEGMIVTFGSALSGENITIAQKTYGLQYTREDSVLMSSISNYYRTHYTHELFTGFASGRTYTVGDLLAMGSSIFKSVEESTARMAIGQTATNITQEALSFGSAYSTGLLDAYNNNYDTGTAVFSAFVQGMSEVLSEHMHIDDLFGGDKPAASNIFELLLKYPALSGASEGFEEVAGSLINDLGEWWRMKDRASFIEDAKEVMATYAANGIEISEGKAIALVIGNQLLDDFCGGFASGVFFELVGGNIRLANTEVTLEDGTQIKGMKAVKWAKQNLALDPEVRTEILKNMRTAGYSDEKINMCNDLFDSIAHDPSMLLRPESTQFFDAITGTQEIDQSVLQDQLYDLEQVKAGVIAAMGTEITKEERDAMAMKGTDHYEMMSPERKAEIDELAESGNSKAQYQSGNAQTREAALNAVYAKAEKARGVLTEQFKALNEKIRAAANKKTVVDAENASESAKAAAMVESKMNAFAAAKRKADTAQQSGNLKEHAQAIEEMRSLITQTKAAQQQAKTVETKQQVQAEEMQQQADAELVEDLEVVAQSYQEAKAAAEEAKDFEEQTRPVTTAPVSESIGEEAASEMEEMRAGLENQELISGNEEAITTALEDMAEKAMENGDPDAYNEAMDVLDQFNATGQIDTDIVKSIIGGDQNADSTLESTDEGRTSEIAEADRGVREEQEGVRAWDEEDARIFKELSDHFYKYTGGVRATFKPVENVSKFTQYQIKRFFRRTGKTVAVFDTDSGPVGANANGKIFTRDHKYAGQTLWHEYYETESELQSQFEETAARMPKWMRSKFIDAYRKRGEIANRLSDEQIADEMLPDICGVLGEGEINPMYLFATQHDIDTMSSKEFAALKEQVDDIITAMGDALDSYVGIDDSEIMDDIVGVPVPEPAEVPSASPEMDTIKTVAKADPVTYEGGEVTDPTKSGFSVVSMAHGMNLEAKKTDNGYEYFRKDGSRVTQLTADDIKTTPIGALITASMRSGFIDQTEADAQYDLFAAIGNIMMTVNDFSTAQQFVGAGMFTAMKTNADAQYGTTYDFVSICTKTQAIIDNMSKFMVKNHRGMTDDEILAAYQHTFANGLNVPCPECYVFTRWIGIGKLLDNIYKYQQRFMHMTPEQVKATHDEIEAKLEKDVDEENKIREANGEKKLTRGKAKGNYAKKLMNELATAREKYNVELDGAANPKVLDDLKRTIETLSLKEDTCNALTWIEDVYFGGNGSIKSAKKNDKAIVNADILFDLNRSADFAGTYPDAWNFRCTQGAGYGKAITPYADARVGESIHATANTGFIKEVAKRSPKGVNLFTTEDGTLTKEASTVLRNAQAKMLVQSWLGGQRWQSTSDARYENATDYLIAALENQAMGGFAQSYTKVSEAIGMFAKLGLFPNQSLMPKGNGFDADGNLADTSVGGIDPAKAFANREKYGGAKTGVAGTITIGVNDAHVRALINDYVRDFIIPYHASGGKTEVISAMRNVQDRNARTTGRKSQDYTKVQGEKVLSDAALEYYWRHEKGMGKTEFEAKLELIKKTREMRLFIYTKAASDAKLTKAQKGKAKNHPELLEQNPILKRFHDRINSGIWADMGAVPLGKVSGQVFPNEYWNQDLTYDQSGQITQDYLDYCESLGFLPKFAGVAVKGGNFKSDDGNMYAARTVPIKYKYTDESGTEVSVPYQNLAYKYDDAGNITSEIEPYFWKLLVDRRMYGNDGEYIHQRRVNLSALTAEDVTSFAKVKKFTPTGEMARTYDQERSASSAESFVELSQEQISELAAETKLKNLGFSVASVGDGSTGIRPDMDEHERANELRKSSITSVFDTKSSEFFEEDEIKSKGIREVRKFVRDLYDSLQLNGSIFEHKDIAGVRFVFSKNKNGLGESFNKQIETAGDFYNFSRAIVNLKSILDGSRLVYSTNNYRYSDTQRESYDFKSSHVFLGCFEDENRIVPVKLEVKESNTNPNNLYVVVAMGEIERQDEIGKNNKTTNVVENAESLNNEVPKFSAIDRTYKVSWIIEKINPSDGRFLKYIPNELLNDEQIAGKNKALFDDEKKRTLLKASSNENEEDGGFSVASVTNNSELSNKNELTETSQYIGSLVADVIVDRSYERYVEKDYDDGKSGAFRIAVSGLNPKFGEEADARRQSVRNDISSFIYNELSSMISGDFKPGESSAYDVVIELASRIKNNYGLNDEDYELVDEYLYETSDVIKQLGRLGYSYDPTFGYGDDEIGYSLVPLNAPSGYTREQRAKTLEWGKNLRERQADQSTYEQMFKQIDQQDKYEAKIEKLQDRIDQLRANGKQLREDQKEAIKELKRQQRELRAQDRAEFNEKLKAAKGDKRRALIEQREQQKARMKRAKQMKDIMKTSKELLDWMQHPSTEGSVPKFLTDVVGEALTSIDFGSSTRPGNKAARDWRSRMQDLATAVTAYEQGIEDGDDRYAGVYMDLGGIPQFVSALAESMKRRNVQHLQDMDANELEALRTLIGSLKNAVQNVNKLNTVQRTQKVTDLGEEQIDYSLAHKLKKRFDSKPMALVDNLVNIDSLDSFNFFDRLGPAGKAISKSLSKGFDSYYSKVKSGQEFTERIMKESGVKVDDINTWDKDLKDHTLASGEKIKMTDSQAMSLYALSKRAAALQHLLGDGIKLGEVKGNNSYAHKVYKLTELDIASITDSLSDRQRAFVDKMQAFLSDEAADWGNEVTNRLFMNDFFGEEFYWPMSVEGNSLNAKEPKASSAFNALLHSGFTNRLQNSTKALELTSATDVFCNHVAQMAAYNGLALPIADTLKWLNYRTRTEDGRPDPERNVASAIERVMGSQGKRYIIQLIKDINGLSSGSTGTEISNWLVSNVKRTAISGKARVVIQQPTAIIRAMAMVDPKYFVKTGNLSENIKDMQDHSDLAWWKDQGNFDIGTGRSVRGILFGSNSKMDAITDKLNSAAGVADNIGWGTIWGAVKSEVEARNPNLEKGTDEYYEAVNDRFEDVINHTQVIDTILHRPQIMRSKDSLVKETTAFMSEPMKTFNMMAQCVWDAKTGVPGAKKRLARSAVAIASSVALNALVTALHDALRDREPDEPIEDRIWENWKSGFVDGINPLTMLPYFSTVWSLMQGYSADRMDMGAIEDMITSVKRVYKAIENGGSNTYTTYGLVAGMVKSVGNVTGIPLNGVLSTLETAANAIVPGALSYKQPSKTSTMRSEMVDRGISKRDATDFLAGANRQTNASKALSILTYDRDGDGEFDFDAEDQSIIADVLGIKSFKPDKESLTSFAEKETVKYLKSKKSQVSEAEYEEVRNIYEDYFELLGLNTGKLPK